MSEGKPETTTPRRVQRSRSRGWRAPEGAVYVGRGSRWGNKWEVGKTYQRGDEEIRVPDRAAAVRLFCADLGCDPQSVGHKAIVDELRGRTLMCWCPLGQPCHADVLLEIANG